MGEKAMAPVYILKILENKSSKDEPLTQQAIIDYLSKDYDMTLERRAVGRHVDNLRKLGYDIKRSKEKDGYYMKKERLFTDAELHFLIDGVIASGYVSKNQAHSLVERLGSMANDDFKYVNESSWVIDHVDKDERADVINTVGVIDEAIQTSRKIHYDFIKYGIDKKLYKSGSYTSSPFKLLIHNQRYYLMCYCDEFDGIVYHRVDHMKNVWIDDNLIAKTIRDVKGYENGFKYDELTTALPYMYSDKPQCVKMIVKNSVIDQVIDWFGKKIEITPSPDGDPEKSLVRIKASAKAMKCWALQYLDNVKVVYPPALVQQICASLEGGKNKYCDGN